MTQSDPKNVSSKGRPNQPDQSANESLSYIDSIKGHLYPIRPDKGPDEYKYYEDEDLKAQRSVAESTASLVSLTKFQIVVAGFGTILVVLALRYARETAQAGIDAARQAAEQVELARKEFLAAHRPELLIHSPRILLGDESVPFYKRPFQVQFSVVNAGSSQCEVLGSAVYLDSMERTDHRVERHPLAMRENGVITPRRFLVGATDSYVVTAEDPRTTDLFHSIVSTTRFLYLSGWVVYKEANPEETTRTTYFSRYYDVDTENFVEVLDPDANRVI